jgi:hypothetical protein
MAMEYFQDLFLFHTLNTVLSGTLTFVKTASLHEGDYSFP